MTPEDWLAENREEILKLLDEGPPMSVIQTIWNASRAEGLKEAVEIARGRGCANIDCVNDSHDAWCPLALARAIEEKMK